MQFFIDIALSLLYFGAFLILCAWAWRFWKMYVNHKYLTKVNGEYIMLEIKLPREILKSPLATELALTSFLQSSGIGNWFYRSFKGQLPMYSSLEIASIEGVIHFYIRTQRKFKGLVESNFYAQYPGIEIVLADDYTSLIRYQHLSNDVFCWGAAYSLSQPWVPKDEETGLPYKDGKGDDRKMKADFLPIKTYVDFELDKNPKDEFKIDPIAQLLEYMGSIGKGEHFWYQIIIQDASVYDGKKRLPAFYVNEGADKHMTLSEMADMFKKQTRTASYIKKGEQAKDEYGDDREKTKTTKNADGTVTTETVKITYKEGKTVPKKDMDLTMEEKAKIEAANKKLSKPLLMGLIRLVYSVKSENFNSSNFAQNVNKIIAYPRSCAGVNQLTLSTVDPYSYPWEDPNGNRVKWRTEEMFEAYVEREGFYPHVESRATLDEWEDRFFWGYPMKTRKMWRMLYEAIFHPFSHPHPSDVSTYNLEEIATLWHLPGADVTTPSLPRIDSAKSVAPVNLPQ